MLAHIFAYVGMPWESPRDEILKNKYTTLTPNRTTPLIFFNIFVVVVVVSRCPRYQDAYMHLRESIYLRTRCVAFTCTPDNLCVSNVQEFPNNMRSNEPIFCLFPVPLLYNIYIESHTIYINFIRTTQKAAIRSVLLMQFVSVTALCVCVVAMCIVRGPRMI